MSTEEQEKEFNRHLRGLEDAYAEITSVFHNSTHYSVRKSLSVAMYELNEAIYNLKEALK